MIHEYQITYSNNAWQLFHTEFGFVGDFPSYDDVLNFIEWHA
jgi:hypothetical protein